jgi:hypothetical protein
MSMVARAADDKDSPRLKVFRPTITASSPERRQSRKPDFFPSDLYPGFVQYRDLGSYNALSDAQLALVSGSAVSACDTTLTGQHDGYINDPSSCYYDPLNDPSVLCTASGGTNTTAACVTTAQAKNVQQGVVRPDIRWLRTHSQR